MGIGRPASSRRRRTFTRLIRLFTSCFTCSRPHSPSSSASSSSRVGSDSGRGVSFLFRRRDHLRRRLGGGGDMGHEFVSLQSWAVSTEAVPLAQGQQRIGAGVDKASLRLADHSVHRGEEQEEQGQLVGEAPGQCGPLPPVVVPQGGKEGGWLEQVIVSHAGGYLPVQGGGGGAGPGVDGVVKFHVAG